MDLLIVSCLPKRPCFGEAILGRIREVLRDFPREEHDLYDEGFDPVLDRAELARATSFEALVLDHARALTACRRLLVVHPDWWGMPPAILKGWIDRVFREGVAYELAGEDGFEKEWRPLLGGKRAFVVVTSDSGDPDRAVLFRDIWEGAVLGACGMETECVVLDDLRRRDPISRKEALDGVARRAAEFLMD